MSKLSGIEGKWLYTRKWGNNLFCFLWLLTEGHTDKDRRFQVYWHMVKACFIHTRLSTSSCQSLCACVQCMRDTHIHHLRLLLVLSQLCCVLLFPVWMYTDVWEIITNLHKVGPHTRTHTHTHTHTRNTYTCSRQVV